MRRLSGTELEDLLVGCAILGTGGGGNLADGLKLVQEVLGKGEIEVVALDELDPGSLIGSPYYCGSVSPEGTGTPDGREALKAFELLEEFLGEPFRGVIPAELGGSATAAALAVAAEKGLPVLDADALGRAAPELQCSYFYVKGIPIAPMAVATPSGDLMVIKEVEGDERAERVVRAIATVSGDVVGVCDHPARVEKLKEACIPGTVSLALRVGQARRRAAEGGGNPPAEVAQAGGGFLLFTGKVGKHIWRIEGGFTVGEIELSGTGDYVGQSYRICYKNENIISWRDGKVDVTVPDLISVLERETGMPITNPNCKEGKEVAVVGFPAPQEWRTPEGLRVLGPAFFSYEVEYVPIERKSG